MSDDIERLAKVAHDLSEQVAVLQNNLNRTLSHIKITDERVHSTRMALGETMRALAIVSRYVPMNSDDFAQAKKALLLAADQYKGSDNDETSS